MQTKMKPIFLLAVLSATAIMLYTSNNVNAQPQTIGFFDVSAFSPRVISISASIRQAEQKSEKDSLRQILNEMESFSPTAKKAPNVKNAK